MSLKKYTQDSPMASSLAHAFRENLLKGVDDFCVTRKVAIISKEVSQSLRRHKYERLRKATAAQLHTAVRRLVTSDALLSNFELRNMLEPLTTGRKKKKSKGTSSGNCVFIFST